MATTNLVEEVFGSISKMSIMEVAKLVKKIKDEYGISDVVPVAAAATSAAVPVVEEKNEFKVTLKESGAEKIKVIKALRTVTALGLKEAKDMVEGAPAVIAETAGKDDAKKIKEALEAAGAKVELS